MKFCAVEGVGGEVGELRLRMSGRWGIVRTGLERRAHVKCLAPHDRDYPTLLRAMAGEDVFESPNGMKKRGQAGFRSVAQ